jgi:hypothetical protein
MQAFDIPAQSQLLIFARSGVQGAHTSPHTPRALYFNDSVVVGYIAGAPQIEIAAHDPQQGVMFYALDQSAATPILQRRTSCLSCHVSASTLDVPGMIVRSHPVDADGRLLPRLGIHDVDHRTTHPDRWAGWFVTSEDVAPPYSTRAHAGNITFSGEGNTSNQVFLDWLASKPETRGYLSASSDVAALLVFDHEMRAINLLTRLNWEARLGSPDVARFVAELSDYLLFVDEAPLPVRLVAPPGFAEALAKRAPKDRHGRSCAQLDLGDRLLQYPCSYMIYSEAFDGLPDAVKQAVYNRMIETLSAAPSPKRARRSAADRTAILEILRATKPGFLQS